MATKHVDKLKEMTQQTLTEYWNDSCSLAELKYAVIRGATGATTNPVIVKTVLEKEFANYEHVLKKFIKDSKGATEDDITWFMIEHAAVEGAKVLKKVFDPTKGRGRISIQTNTKNYQNTAKLVEQALYFSKLAPNMQVKMPATEAGIKAFEEVSYMGVSINATVCFTVAQAIAVAQAVEKGLKRREKEGKSVKNINPVCTLMVGRLDDWLKIVVDKKNIVIDPVALEWAGVASMKRAYEIYQERKYRTKLLSAAYRNHHHWSEFIGGAVIETIPHKWQVRFNNSDIEVKERMNIPVDKTILKQLNKITDFKKAYEPNGMQIKDFVNYGATVKTLLQFANGYDELVKIVRAQMLKI